MDVFIEKDQITSTIDFTADTVADLLRQLAINKETVLVVRNSTVLTEDEKLDNSDSVEILSVVSGG